MDIGGALAAGGAAAIIITFALIAVGAAVFALEIWIVYTIIWRAVKRGMREFNASPLGNVPQVTDHRLRERRTTHERQRGPRDW